MTIDSISGPHLAAAFFCEKVLIEADSVSSFIRIVDRFMVAIPPKLPPGVQLPPNFQFPPPLVQCQLVIILKAGGIPGGNYNMKMNISKPDGSEMPGQNFQVFFNGSDDNGVAVISPVTIPNPPQGLHWFDIYFEEQLITRIPLRVQHQQIQIQQMSFPQ